MRKVLVIGSGGSGKSTFARTLAARTGLPLTHLDQLYWRSGWTHVSEAEWDATIADLLRGDSWIIDGNYGRTLPVRLEACDTVIFLDRSRWVCLWRVLKRQLRFAGAPRPDLPAGCPERLDLEFLAWVWSYPFRRRPVILRRLAEIAGEKQVVILRNGRSETRFLASIERE